MDQEYLNDKEKALIIAFNTNQPMVEAVRKVLMAPMYQQGVLAKGRKLESDSKNWVYSLIDNSKSDEEIGKSVRAAVQGISFLQAGFENLTSFQPDAPKKEGKNPAL